MLTIDTSWINITDDYDEKVSIGKEIVARNPQIYTESMTNIIWKTINKYCSLRSQEQKEQLYYLSVYDYWNYGSTIDEEIYLAFENKTDKQKREYITERNRWQYYNFMNDPNDWHLLRNKFEAYKLLKDYYKRDIIELTGEKDRAEFEAFVKKHSEFVVKPVGGSCAFGVQKVSADSYSCFDELFKAMLKLLGNLEGLSKLEKVKSLVIEELMEQVDELAAFHPASINAVRLITIRTGKSVSFFYPWIKFGASGSFIASAAVNGFDAGIDPKTGVINTDGVKENGERVELHPDSGIRFKGYQIPRWEELLDFATELALRLPSFRYVGWDVVLTPKGWCVMEGNHAGQLMGQMLYQKGLRREFEEAIGWHNS
ncbi:MAG: hypothetical protein IKP00_03780 [Victivallales bacterium]|nr:hypothetical protein [Victivallales bacterium]